MIAVEAHLRAETVGLRVLIDGRGDVLTCRLDGDPSHPLDALRRGTDLLSIIRAMIPILLRTGVRLDVVAANVCIGRAGSGVKQNALARMLRLPAAHLGT